MRVLFLEAVGVIGGAERILLDLITAVRSSRPDVTFGLVAGAEGPLVDAARSLGVQVTVLPLPARLASLGDTRLAGAGARGLAVFGMQAGLGSLATVAYALRLRTEIRRFRPTLVHSNGMKMHVLAAAVCPRGVPLVWWLHDFMADRRIMAHALRATAPRADLAIAISHAVARDAEQILGAVPIRVVHNATDTEHFVPTGDALDLDCLAGLPPALPSTIRIGIVATYAKWKGQDVFLEAAHRVLERANLPPMRFYVIGGPIYQTAASQFERAELQALALKAPGHSAIGFVGFQPDPARAYRALDIVVHASTRPEPFGLTIIEAMSCGRPVVVARAGGAVELFDEGIDALGVEPGDPRALAEAIVDLVVDADRRKRIGRTARLAAVERFGRDRFAHEMLAAYASLRGRL